MTKLSFLLSAWLWLLPILGMADTAISQEEFARLNSTEFHRMVDQEAEHILERLSHRLSAQEKNALQIVRKKLIAVLQSNNPFLHIKELLIKHGLGAGITAAVTEFTTIIVLPSIFTAAGLPSLALISAGSPSFAVTVPMYIAWSNARIKKKLAASLGIPNLKELDKLRKGLLKFSIETKVHATLIKGVEGLEEISILKRKFARFRRRPQGHAIDLFELEKIYKQHIGKESFEIIKEYQENPKLYATLMVNHIKNDREAANALVELGRERLRTTHAPLTYQQESILFSVQERLQQVAHMKEEARHTKKAMKSHGKKIVSEFYDNIVDDLNAIEYDLKRFEYGLLNQISLEEDISSVSLKESNVQAAERLAHLQRLMNEVEYHPNQPRNARHLRQILAKMTKRNARWNPSKVALAWDKSCFGLMQSLLAAP